MKIGAPIQAYDTDLAVADLERWLAQALPHQQAVCPSCSQHRPDSCAPTCKEASKALSIDPVRYPIEPQVVPLVFQLYATRLLQPCWSCEGHMRTLEGESSLWKLPQVNFYCSSPIYLQLLNRSLVRAQAAGNFTYRWHIVVCEFSQSLDVTYSLQPNLYQVADPSLGAIQNDLRLLADGLLMNLRNEALQMLQELRKAA